LPTIDAKVRVDPNPAQVGPSLLTIELIRPDGMIIEGAQVSIRGDMTHAGMVPVFGKSVEIAPGIYEAPVEWTMAGDWQLSLTVQEERGATTQLEIPFSVDPASAQP
jgi:hypothetical protein